MTLLPRVALMMFCEYMPFNDFEKYLQFGFDFRAGDFEHIRWIVGEFQMPKLAGLAVFQGILAYVFPPNVAGQQLAQIVVSSFNCVMLYLVASNAGKKVGLASSLLYALYPSNIVSSQVTTNHHGATLMLLIAAWFIIRALKADRRRALILAAAAGLFIALSDFIHQSAAIFLLAAVIFLTARGIFSCMQNKPLFSPARLMPLALAAVMTVVYLLSAFFGIRLLYSAGLTSDTKGVTPLFKIVIGLNSETYGTYSEDFNNIKDVPREDQRRECIRLIKERLSDLGVTGLYRLVRDKTISAWFREDSYFYWYSDAALSAIYAEADADESGELWREWDFLKKLMDGLTQLDMCYVNLIYLLTIVWLVLSISKSGYEFDMLLVLIVLGWMLFIMISETQSRYRYTAMPAYIIMASFGTREIFYKYEQINFHK